MDYIKAVICLLVIQSATSARNQNAGNTRVATDNQILEATSPAKDLQRVPRQSYCSRCVSAYDDRGRNDYYRQPGLNPYYGGDSGRRSSYDDRNWYHYPERYDDRTRYNPRYPERYDDRYIRRYSSSRYGNRYDNQYDNRNGYDPYEYRGNGYDERDRNYVQQYGHQYYGDLYSRDRYLHRGYYPQRYNNNDDYPNRGGGFDHRNYRPWDETHRGTSGFDISGRGYYFANRQNEAPTPSFHYRTQPIQPQQQGSPYNPYSQHMQESDTRPQNHSSQSSPSSSSKNDGSSYHKYNKEDRPSHSIENSKNYGNNWNNSPGYQGIDQDAQSAPYGTRPRTLGTSYLFQREHESSVNDSSKLDQSSSQTIVEDTATKSSKEINEKNMQGS